MAYSVPTLAYAGVGCLGPPRPSWGPCDPLSPNATSLTSQTRREKARSFAFVKAAPPACDSRSWTDAWRASLLLQSRREPHHTLRCMVSFAYGSNPTRTHPQPFLCIISSLTVRRPPHIHLACLRRQLCLVTRLVVILIFSGGTPLLPKGKHAPQRKRVHVHAASLHDRPCLSYTLTHDHAHVALV